MDETPPAKLAARSKRLWVAVVSKYDLRPDELVVLEDACREMDLISRLQTAITRKGAALTVMGSQGQEVAAPLISEIRQHRATLKTLLGSLKLPDVTGVGQTAGDRSTSARAAANARWGNDG